MTMWNTVQKNENGDYLGLYGYDTGTKKVEDRQGRVSWQRGRAGETEAQMAVQLAQGEPSRETDPVDRLIHK